MKKTLGTKISELRREKGLKQDEVAERLGVSAQAVSKWENDISCPDIMILPELARLLGVSVDALLSDDEKAVETKYIPPDERRSFDDMILRIKVDADEDTHVRVNLPIPLIKAFLESGISIGGLTGGTVGTNIDFAQIMSIVESGAVGKLVEIDADGAHVEIVVE